MPSDRTRASILDAAERLYAERGFSDVTLRDIVAAAGVNLAAVNYHFGSKDELIAELFVTRSIATNRERLSELKAVEAAGGGRADIDAVLRALVGPTVRGCLGPENERSTHYFFTAVRFGIRIEDAERNREIQDKIGKLRRHAFVVEDAPVIEAQQRIIDKARKPLDPIVLSIDVGTMRWRRAIDRLVEAETAA